MPFELHTWGPAFSLPSIDSDCLVAIAYLRLTLPADAWVLVPTSDTSISPTRDLPALKDGDVIVGGFQNIVNYLAKISNGEWDLDSPKHFPFPLSRADIIAFQSHIPTHASPLLSLLLYLSPKNYAHATRPAYTPLLPWPAQYIIPPQRRAVARTRCEGLGVQGGELDDDDDDEDGRRMRGGAGAGLGGGLIPDALRGGSGGATGQKKTPTVTSAVQTHISGPRSVVSSLIDTLCIPLTTLLSSSSSSSSSNSNNDHKKTHHYLLTNPSTIDCLTLGYLSLLLIPSLPISFPQETIRKKYPLLSAFVEKGVRDIYTGETIVGEALEGRTTEGGLPWRKPGVVGAKMAERMIGGWVGDCIPLLGFGGGNIVLHGGDDENRREEEGEVILGKKSSSENFISPAVMAVTTTLAAAVVGVFYYAAGNVNERGKEKRLEDMGEAGALFKGLDFGGKGEGRGREGEVGLEVGVDGRGDGEG